MTLQGLPQQIAAGQRYPLTIVLSDPAIRKAGFMLNVAAEDAPAGELNSTDDRTESEGARARSTRSGSKLTGDSASEWQLVWTAPDPLPPIIRFDLWGNAANDDLSPLGDHLHHRSWQLSPAP